MTPSIRDEIRAKIRDLNAQIETLTATLNIFGGKYATSTNGDEPKKERKSHQAQFDAMMTILTEHKRRALRASQLEKELKEKGQFTGSDTTVVHHLERAVRLGYVLKNQDGYRISPTIKKITGKSAALKPLNAKYRPNPANGTNYELVLKALQAADGPQKGAAIQAVAVAGGAKMASDTAVYGFLARAVREGKAKKSEEGYVITEQGRA